MVLLHHITLRRLLGKRRIFVVFVTLITISVMYLCYQAFSVRQLGEELSAEHSKRKGANFRSSYQKADYPAHLLRSAASSPSSNGDLQRDDVAVAGFRDHGIRIRGVLIEHVQLYIPNSKGNFRCAHSNEEVAYHRVNDNYCDCNDGSDEPSTSACQDGRFFCAHQPPHPAKSVSVLSSRVNDGICDCCDGSDEWAAMTVAEHVRIDETWEKRLNIDQVPCKDRCLTIRITMERGL